MYVFIRCSLKTNICKLFGQNIYSVQSSCCNMITNWTLNPGLIYWHGKYMLGIFMVYKILKCLRTVSQKRMHHYYKTPVKVELIWLKTYFIKLMQHAWASNMLTWEFRDFYKGKRFELTYYRENLTLSTTCTFLETLEFFLFILSEKMVLWKHTVNFGLEMV